MPWSAGVFNRLNGATGWVDDANAFIGIEASRHDTQDNDFRDGINACLNKDGTNLVTGNLNINNYRLTSVGAATARTDAPRAGQVQDGDFVWLGTTGGTATAQTATATPAITAYKAGQKFRMLVGAALGSTGISPTGHSININGIGAKQIVSADGLNSSPTIGSWVAGALLELTYDGTYFRITNDPGGWKDWTPTLAAPIGSVSAVTVYFAKFRKIGHQVTITGYVGFTGTGVGPQFEITNPPVALAIASVAYVIQPVFVNYAAINYFGYMYNNSATNIAFTKDVAANSFGTSSGTVRFCYIYQGQ